MNDIFILFHLSLGEFLHRMAGFFLYVSNTTSELHSHLCFHDSGKVSISHEQRIVCSVRGRYVIYYNERLSNKAYPRYYSWYAFYELCELEVYGEILINILLSVKNFF